MQQSCDFQSTCRQRTMYIVHSVKSRNILLLVPGAMYLYKCFYYVHVMKSWWLAKVVALDKHRYKTSHIANSSQVSFEKWWKRCKAIICSQQSSCRNVKLLRWSKKPTTVNNSSKRIEKMPTMYVVQQEKALTNFLHYKNKNSHSAFCYTIHFFKNPPNGKVETQPSNLSIRLSSAHSYALPYLYWL